MLIFKNIKAMPLYLENLQSNLRNIPLWRTGFSIIPELKVKRVLEKARHRKGHTVWFHSYKVRNQSKSIFGVRSQDSSYLSGYGDWKGEWGVSGAIQMCLDLDFGYTCVYCLWKFSNLYYTLNICTFLYVLYFIKKYTKS